MGVTFTGVDARGLHDAAITRAELEKQGLSPLEIDKKLGIHGGVSIAGMGVALTPTHELAKGELNSEVASSAGNLDNSSNQAYDMGVLLNMQNNGLVINPLHQNMASSRRRKFLDGTDNTFNSDFIFKPSHTQEPHPELVASVEKKEDLEEHSWPYTWAKHHHEEAMNHSERAEQMSENFGLHVLIPGLENGTKASKQSTDVIANSGINSPVDGGSARREKDSKPSDSAAAGETAAAGVSGSSGVTVGDMLDSGSGPNQLFNEVYMKLQQEKDGAKRAKLESKLNQVLGVMNRLLGAEDGVAGADGTAGAGAAMTLAGANNVTSGAGSQDGYPVEMIAGQSGMVTSGVAGSSIAENPQQPTPLSGPVQPEGMVNYTQTAPTDAARGDMSPLDSLTTSATPAIQPQTAPGAPQLTTDPAAGLALQQQQSLPTTTGPAVPSHAVGKMNHHNNHKVLADQMKAGQIAATNVVHHTGNHLKGVDHNKHTHSKASSMAGSSGANSTNDQTGMTATKGKWCLFEVLALPCELAVGFGDDDLITEVDHDGAAYEAGVCVGDFIHSVDGVLFCDLEDEEQKDVLLAKGEGEDEDLLDGVVVVFRRWIPELSQSEVENTVLESGENSFAVYRVSIEIPSKAITGGGKTPDTKTSVDKILGIEWNFADKEILQPIDPANPTAEPEVHHLTPGVGAPVAIKSVAKGSLAEKLGIAITDSLVAISDERFDDIETDQHRDSLLNLTDDNILQPLQVKLQTAKNALGKGEPSPRSVKLKIEFQRAFELVDVEDPNSCPGEVIATYLGQLQDVSLFGGHVSTK